MNGLNIVSTNENETIFTIADNIKVTLYAESFNKNGEMTVEYDEKTLTEEKVGAIVNSYFQRLVEYLENKKLMDSNNENIES